jgi:hypothetical protein
MAREQFRAAARRHGGPWKILVILALIIAGLVILLRALRH